MRPTEYTGGKEMKSARWWKHRAGTHNVNAKGDSQMTLQSLTQAVVALMPTTIEAQQTVYWLVLVGGALLALVAIWRVMDKCLDFFEDRRAMREADTPELTRRQQLEAVALYPRRGI